MTNPDTHAPTSEAVERGARAYTRALLTCYDVVVLGLVSRFVWRAPRARTQHHYDLHVGARHLELGPGTGYFLQHSLRRRPPERLALADLNPEVLTYSARRLALHRPEIYERNILRPLEIDPPRFDSIGLSFLLHCLPGCIRDKAVVFDHAAAVCAPGGRIFGSTVLGRREPHSPVARLLLAWFNRKGMFANTGDTLEDLERQLAHRFTDYRVARCGSVAFFQARCAHDTVS
ncbi:class I SAM-dependent methyltransferase [Nocardia araoensis]|uniref:class I SAM-dependent methyltransferase n=1 Tax=Nocardia araoensis TaxID=228600 RepID=UPI000311CE53|nr:class I SAM-dependent methyltransferase [Nocardia araoensis]